jgi:uncharacterized protein (DUF58 family)
MPEHSLTDTRLRDQAEALAAELPPLLVSAERLASVVSLGVHGRRKSGMGENFWQFRRFQAEDASTAIDWRQSAKSQHLYVREREWEAAEAVWLWRDASPGMRFKSDFTQTTKLDRANLLTLALGTLLVRGGERIALYGDGRAPAIGRKTVGRIAHELSDSALSDAALPPDAPVSKNSSFVWFSDFLSPLGEIETTLRRLARNGLTGHLVHIVDPVEEDFPFSGRTRFESPLGQASDIFGRAESLQSAYRTRFRAHADTLRDLSRRLNWTYLAHRTDKRPEIALIALFEALGGVEAKMRIA